ncbi:MAG: DUF456 domain-containing protein [Nocardioides sp.]|nr:DUF456 domain-containing protein [Nocardioides sp.]
MTLLEVGISLAIALGLVGIVVPLLPGTGLIGIAVLVWAWTTGGSTAWVIFSIVAVWLLLGTIVKYAVPGRQMTRAGVPSSTLLLGGLLGVVGFFVIPVVGIVVGFVAGVYLAEYRRLGSGDASRSTVAEVKAVGASMLIEFSAGVLAALTWATGVVLT